MKIQIKLMSGDTLDYIPRSVRGERCKIITHRPHIERLVLEHLKLPFNTHFIKLLTDEDQKEFDDVYYNMNGIKRKSEYYLDNQIIFAFAQSYKDHRDSFFESCEQILSKAKELYYSIDTSIRELTSDKLNKILEENGFNVYISLSNYYDIKVELENALWQMSNCLGIPLDIRGYDLQKNDKKKMSPNPTITILYYTRSIEKCEQKLEQLKI